MSEIAKNEVEHIAGLARIRVSDEEKEKLAKELGDILSYVNKLKEVNVDGVEPVANITGLENILRKDDSMKKMLDEQAVDARRLVEMAPRKKDNYVEVKAVFGE